jgi:hypothetical protein
MKSRRTIGTLIGGLALSIGLVGCFGNTTGGDNTEYDHVKVSQDTFLDSLFTHFSDDELSNLPIGWNTDSNGTTTSYENKMEVSYRGSTRHHVRIEVEKRIDLGEEKPNFVRIISDVSREGRKDIRGNPIIYGSVGVVIFNDVGAINPDTSFFVSYGPRQRDDLPFDEMPEMISDILEIGLNKGPEVIFDHAGRPYVNDTNYTRQGEIIF